MAFFSTFGERASSAMSMSIVYALMAFLFIINIISLSFPLTGEIKAPLFLMCIYYWTIYRPTLLPPWAVFLIGCVMDVLSGLPIGMNAIVFVLAQRIVFKQRRFLMGQSFIMIWVGFAMVVFASVIVQWIIFALIHWRWFVPDTFLISSLFGIALFPLICITLHLTHKILPTPNSIIRTGVVQKYKTESGG